MRIVMSSPTHSGRDIPAQSWFEVFLRKNLTHKEIGWQDIGEVFFRYTLLKTKRFSLYLHQLDAPNWHPVGCHDHPWWFWTLLLKGGYDEKIGDTITRRLPGDLLYRKSTHSHDVVTPYGRSWSLVLTGPKSRDWGFQSCQD
jgi:hypothetical protein